MTPPVTDWFATKILRTTDTKKGPTNGALYSSIYQATFIRLVGPVWQDQHQQMALAEVRLALPNE